MKKAFEVAQAKQQWVNTMRQTYPEFNPKLWGRSHNYRMVHPQVPLTD